MEMCILWYRLFREMFTGQKSWEDSAISPSRQTRRIPFGTAEIRCAAMSSITLTAQTAEVHGHAAKPLRKRNWECIHATKRMMAGFPHLYYMASPHLALEFLEQCVSYRKEQEKTR